jgi:hypothetical protein
MRGRRGLKRYTTHNHLIHLYTYTPIHLYTYTPIHLHTYTPIHLHTYTPIHLTYPLYTLHADEEEELSYGVDGGVGGGRYILLNPSLYAMNMY